MRVPEERAVYLTLGDLLSLADNDIDDDGNRNNGLKRGGGGSGGGGGRYLLYFLRTRPFLELTANYRHRQRIDHLSAISG